MPVISAELYDALRSANVPEAQARAAAEAVVRSDQGERLARIETRLDSVEARLDRVETQLAALAKELSAVRADLTQELSTVRADLTQELVRQGANVQILQRWIYVVLGGIVLLFLRSFIVL